MGKVFTGESELTDPAFFPFKKGREYSILRKQPTDEKHHAVGDLVVHLKSSYAYRDDVFVHEFENKKNSLVYEYVLHVGESSDLWRDFLEEKEQSPPGS